MDSRRVIMVDVENVFVRPALEQRLDPGASGKRPLGRGCRASRIRYDLRSMRIP
jgi:hypothetical protein